MAEREAYTDQSQHTGTADERATESLIRTVDHLKSTTTNMRGFADSVDHLLNALEEFYPFIDKLISGTQSLRSSIGIPPYPARYPYRRHR